MAVNKKLVLKILVIALIAIDVAATITLFVFHIIALSNILNPDFDANSATGFLGWIVADKGKTYGFALVLPTFIILAGNIVGLVFYVRKQTKKEPVKLDDLTEEQKAELRKQMLNDLDK